MRKPRPDSKLLNLPEEQQARLAEWLMSGIPYHQVKDMVQKEFSVSTSLSALSLFYQEFVAVELVARRRRAVSTADEVAAEAEKTPGRFDAATIDALKQKAFELSISPGARPGDVKQLFSLVLKARDQQLAERDIGIKLRRLELLEKNAADAKATIKAATSGASGLTPETLHTIEEALKLL